MISSLPNLAAWFPGWLNDIRGIQLIESPGDHPDESILFVYAEEEGLYCSIKTDECIMALSILDQGFPEIIRKFGEIAHPQLFTELMISLLS